MVTDAKPKLRLVWSAPNRIPAVPVIWAVVELQSLREWIESLPFKPVRLEVRLPPREDK